MTEKPSARSNRRILAILLGLTAGMFAFGYALVPMYNVICEVTGLNGKTGRLSEQAAAAVGVDRNRTVTVEFITTVNENMPWEFHGEVKKMTVHPGEISQASFYAKNNADHAIVGQAIPSVSPGTAAKYFNKTECFCFSQQTLQAGEAKDMPVRFIVDPRLPDDIHTITLSYTFFDTDRGAGSTHPNRRARLDRFDGRRNLALQVD